VFQYKRNLFTYRNWKHNELLLEVFQYKRNLFTYRNWKHNVELAYGMAGIIFLRILPTLGVNQCIWEHGEQNIN